MAVSFITSSVYLVLVDIIYVDHIATVTDRCDVINSAILYQSSYAAKS